MIFLKKNKPTPPIETTVAGVPALQPPYHMAVGPKYRHMTVVV
jgi:hypothetical protein